ncbi:hypothetical protein E2C01_001978 [Portunus trituberculatus]|uniref:Uncharacterized protein n=1 Tax=Portunus trituberculatus TaxID=210409 RepID=A0A5B7CJM5_PORTR|nr:hypothetical protein [Portunus trituberculatus]
MMSSHTPTATQVNRDSGAPVVLVVAVMMYQAVSEPAVQAVTALPHSLQPSTVPSVHLCKATYGAAAVPASQSPDVANPSGPPPVPHPARQPLGSNTFSHIFPNDNITPPLRVTAVPAHSDDVLARW